MQHPAAQTTSPKAQFSAARTNCQDTRRDLSGRAHPRCAAFIYISVTASCSPAGTGGHRGLKSFSLCKSTINLLYNIDVIDFANTQPTNNDLLHELLAVQNKTGAHHMHDLRRLQGAPQTSAEVNTPTRACGQPAIHPRLKITAAVCKICTCV